LKISSPCPSATVQRRLERQRAGNAKVPVVYRFCGTRSFAQIAADVADQSRVFLELIGPGQGSTASSGIKARKGSAMYAHCVRKNRVSRSSTKSKRRLPCRLFQIIENNPGHLMEYLSEKSNCTTSSVGWLQSDPGSSCSLETTNNYLLVRLAVVRPARVGGFAERRGDQPNLSTFLGDYAARNMWHRLATVCDR
jgi:hypothetical protein